MMNTTEEELGSGSTKKQRTTPALTDYFLPQHALFERAGLGFVSASVIGFALPLAQGGSDLPLAARVKHRYHIGQCLGGKVAYGPLVIASLEHALATWRGQRDLLNTFVAATGYGLVCASRHYGAGRRLVAAALPLVMGCAWTWGEYVARGTNDLPPWKYELERAAATSLPAADD